MNRRFEAKKLVVASHNPGKVRELRDLLADFDVDLISAGDLGLPEPEETGQTFVANAELKALAAATGANLCALADDSGLAVAALNGDPGIYSARWAGPEKDFDLAMEKVWTALDGNSDRRAQFHCALSLAWPDGHLETFEGIVTGQLVWPRRGDNGFGYDPIFQPDGYDRTFGEMTHEEKNPLTHRARAFEQLIDACFTAD